MLADATVTLPVIDTSTIAGRNRVLAALPADACSVLRPKLERVQLCMREMLYERHQPLQHVYFPLSGLVSVFIGFEDGFQAEVAIIGFEGIVGFPAFKGDPLETEAVVQVAGEAFRMTAADFAQSVETIAELRVALRRYRSGLLAQTMQLAACNSHHSLEKRMTRWLLTVQDRVGSDRIPITQEVLAAVLCVHRPSITVVAGRLQRAGLIRYSDGMLTIEDRRGIEDATCECYRALRAQTAR